MFKNATIYKLGALPDGGIIAAEESMKADEFAPCGSSQEKSVGWVCPRGHEYGAMIESSDGHHFARLAIETKSVPSSELTKHTEARCAEIEATTGRKPGKKERKEIKSDVHMQLLPKAFPKRKDVLVWIDEANQRIVVDTSSSAVADTVVVQLARIGFTVLMLNTVQSAGAFMLNTLLGFEDDTVPQNFSLGRECELQALDESKARATFKNHPLDGDDVCDHIKQGKSVTKLGLCTANASFVMSDSMVLKKIDLIWEESKSEDDDAFDADVFVTTKVLGDAITNLIASLGGELEVEA
ncbi:recombination-associated protein RdgC [Polynucleobacter sp. UK-Kesae-W10]|uniref:recombination-associated protein RdgC n=1 Tax=Polynucleobacter sp. UK-Kesae-W10 TaxID=1819738 RepID=UPI001C0AF73B|nr:recombination-associated protein RdgC [Polynucleobacter sp. UK-Kesae-W10]MBU3577494.1 recombination-associated protein RdgC [Polynucleobacter sp. UK-Kesae-W10]